MRTELFDRGWMDVCNSTEYILQQSAALVFKIILRLIWQYKVDPCGLRGRLASKASQPFRIRPNALLRYKVESFLIQ